MTKRILLLNLLFLVACVYVGRRVYQDYEAFNENHKVVAPEAESADANGQGPAKSAPARVPISPTDYTVVSEKNLFLESRSVQTAAAPAIVEAAPPLNPKPILMGVATVGTEPRAFIQTMKSAPGKRATEILRLGQTYEGYKVSSIQKGTVELSYTSASGNVTKHVLDLRDDTKRGLRTAVKTPLAQSQVFSVGGQPQPAAPGQPVAPGQGQTQVVDEQGRRVVRTPFGDMPVGGAGGAQRGPNVSPAAQNQLLQQQELQQQQQRTNQPLRRNEILNEQGQRIIRTPFGDIVRPPDTPPPTTNPPPPEN